MMEENQDTIKRKAFSSTIWKFLERIIAQAVTLIVSIVIARILIPEDYAIVSLVLIFFNFANVFISGGLNTALIQKKDADNIDYSTVLWVTLVLAIAIYFTLFFSAPLIAQLFSDVDQDLLILVIRIMGLTLPIAGIKSIWCAYISSRLEFRKFFFATIIGTLISAVVGIWMAIKGYGVWALVAQQMVNTTIDTIILIVTTRLHIKLKISFSKLKILFKYGWKVFVSSLVNTAYGESLAFIFGIKFTAEDLSFYTKGKKFPETISTSLTSTFSAVLFPVLAKFQDDKEKVLRYTRLFMRVCSFIVFPIMIGFLAVADNFVFVVLTEKWMGAALYIKIFCLCCMFDIVAIGNCETIKAIGRSDVYLIMEIIKKACYLVIIILFVIFSPSPEILVISSGVCVVVQLIVNSVPNQKLIGYRFRDQILDLLPSLLMSAVMFGIVYGFGYIPMNRILLLILQIIIGFIVYFGLAILTRNKSLKYIVDTIKSRFHKKEIVEDSSDKTNE